MQKVIILNGCPGIGKDTIGCFIADMNQDKDVRMLSFKKPMFDIALSMLGEEGYESFLYLYEDRRYKEQPTPLLGGLSPRGFMIWLSEDVMKPRFGEQYFGRRMVENVKADSSASVITDGGFPEETIALIAAGIQVHVCRLHRDGYSFAGDSRNYLHLPDWLGVNNYSEADYVLRDGKPGFTALQITNDYLK